MKDGGYICSTCGKVHEGLPTDWGFGLPDEVYALSYLEKYRRSRSNADLCALDEKRFYFRGLLMIPFTHQEGHFAWGVWVEVSSIVHEFYLGNFSNEMAQGTRFPGTLANAIPGFTDLVGVPLDVEIQSAKSRPLFSFPAAARHDLATDQRGGIGPARHHQFLELCGYFEGSDA